MQRPLIWKLHHCGASPNSRHKPLIPILEWLGWLTMQAAGNLLPDVLSGLHRHGPELRQNLPVRCNLTHIAHHEDLRVVGNAEVGVEFDSASTSLWQSNHIRQGVGSHASRPDQRVGFDYFSRLQTHEGGSNLGDGVSETHFDPTLLELFFSVRAQIFFEGG